MNVDMPVRVMLVADDIDLRRRFYALLHPCIDLDVVADVPAGRLVVPIARYLKPDVILIDIQTARREEIDMIHQIRAASPRSRVMALIREIDERQVRAALQAGVIYIIAHQMMGDGLVALIRGTTAIHLPLAPAPSVSLSSG